MKKTPKYPNMINRHDVANILAGHPSKDLVEEHARRGHNVENWLKNRAPASRESRLEMVKKKHFGGLCHQCAGFSDYKAIYKMD